MSNPSLSERPDPRLLLARLKADLATPKYHNQRTTFNGIVFASKREAEWYQVLLILERAGQLSKLELQPRYPLIVNGVQVSTYVADFRYVDKDGETVVEDAKGIRTAVYKLKRALMKALYEIEIREV